MFRRVLVVLGLGLVACGGNGSSPSGGETLDAAAPPPDQGGTDASAPPSPGSDGAPPTTGGSEGGGPDSGSAKPVLQISVSPSDIVPRASNDPLVMMQALQADTGGTTNLRFQSNKSMTDNLYPVGSPNNNHIAPPSERKVLHRDHDLGQTFVTGDQGFRLQSLYLKVGPDPTAAVTAGAPGARLALQFFEVQGTPKVNDSGTPGFLKNSDGTPKFDRSMSPQLDDYIEGETYVPMLLAEGTLPQTLAPNDFIMLTIQGEPLVLSPHKGYGFLLLFPEVAADRALSLANAYFGSYQPDPTNTVVGHSIRREGGAGMPQSPFFSPDLPADYATRLAQPPGTLGFPDVDTWRDLFFTITATPGSVTK